MIRAVLSTVGTSVLTNYVRQSGREIPAIIDEEVLTWMADAPPAQVSAEVNALDKLKIETDKHHLYFLVSHSERGERAAGILEKFFRNSGFDSKLIRVSGLGFNTGQFRDLGLVNVVREVLRINRDYDEMVVNVTGGFKAEAGYALLGGLLAGAQVVYLHEEFKQLIHLPAMPVKLDLELYLEHVAQLRSIINQTDARMANKLFEQLDQKAKLFLERTPRQDPEFAVRRFRLSPVGLMLEERLEGRSEKVIIRVQTGKQGSHSILWGDGIANFADLPPEIRNFLRELFAGFGELELKLTRFGNQPFSDNPGVRRIQKHDLGVQFDLVCRSGFQTMIVCCGSEEQGLRTTERLNRYAIARD